MFAKAAVKIHSDNYQATIAEIQEVFKAKFPGNLFNYYIYEDYVNKRYTGESKFLSLLSFFTVIAIILASMGLIGLVSFFMVQKTKDIGVRKALGAYSGGIVLMYTNRYLKLILFSSVFSWPLAYWILSKWIQNYAYHTNISLLYFFMGLLIIGFISMVAIMSNTIKVATTNPVESLRYE
jgi:putative ABC transport system permease protein